MPRPSFRGWNGAHLRSLREARGWTQRQLAIRLALYPAMIGKWERGEVVPAPGRVAALAEAFGVRPQEFTVTPVAEGSLTDLRGWAGLPRPAAAAAAGLATDRLLRIEHLTIRPSAAEAARLAAVYGVAVGVIGAAWDRQRDRELTEIGREAPAVPLEVMRRTLVVGRPGTVADEIVEG